MQTVVVREKLYFVCQYTGALISKCYFLPVGKKLRAKEGSFATLPILLRFYFEKENEEFTPKFNSIKKTVETFYNQPDIPLAPKLDVHAPPLNEEQLFTYLQDQPFWENVSIAASIDDVNKKRKSK